MSRGRSGRPATPTPERHDASDGDEVICLLTLSLFFVCLGARAEALETKAVAEVEAAAAQAAVSAAEAEIAASQVRLLRRHPELFGL